MLRSLYNGLAIACCLAGSFFSALAYGEHFNTNPSPCQINAVWDCGIVNHSRYALLRGIPIALIGVLGYGLLIALVGRLPWLAFAGALAGFLFSLRYTYVEWRVLHLWCLYCVTSEILIALVAIFTFLAARSRPSPLTPHP